MAHLLEHNVLEIIVLRLIFKLDEYKVPFKFQHPTTYPRADLYLDACPYTRLSNYDYNLNRPNTQPAAVRLSVDITDMDDVSPCIWHSKECKSPLCALDSPDTLKLAPTPNKQTERAFTLRLNIVVADSELDTEIERDSLLVNLDPILRATQQDWEMEESRNEGEQMVWKKYQESIALRKHRIELLNEWKNQKVSEWVYQVVGGTNGNLGEH
ncbi:hypothetical protein BDZ89DRAFT_1134282 [Hymenopellis radicata]|nr:hypothetical protein BDZ89DRAFT_1134282 [Hymenopellis radicata]